MQLKVIFASVIAAFSLTVQAGLHPPKDILSILFQKKNLWSSPETEVFFPFSPDWDTVSLRWNTHDQPTFKAIVKPGNEADVQTVVKLAGKFHIPILTVGGKHAFSFTSFNGVGLDLGHFNSIEVDAEASEITVGGSVRFQDVYDPLFEIGKELQHGSCPCPGILGLALGGGIGRFNGPHGLVLDALLSVRLVTSTGAIVTASSTSHPDLFWAIRGAGHNFGVVTSATFRVHDLSNGGNPVLSADLIFPASANATYFSHLESIIETFPTQLSVFTFIGYDAERGEPVLMSNVVFLGDEATGREILAPFLAMGPVVEAVYTVPINKLAYEAQFGFYASFCGFGFRSAVWGANLLQLTKEPWVETFETMAGWYEREPGIRSSGLLIELMGREGVADVPRGETAYPWRDDVGTVMIQTLWDEDKDLDTALQMGTELRDKVAATSGHDGLTVYMNYVHGDETPEQMYGDSLPRLVELKGEWDPQEMFSFYRPVPLI